MLEFGMAVQVLRAEVAHRDVLRNLMELYVYDFSEMLALEVEDNGRFKEPPLDAYWRDDWRFPFLIHAGSALAGFALVHRKSRVSPANDVWDMAEFFVLRRHRRARVGLDAAHQIFAGHAGAWEVRQRKENTAATTFWRSAIGAYTGGRFTEDMLDDARWCGPIQRFTSPSTPP
jgi:predicted acetyltransferase